MFISKADFRKQLMDDSMEGVGFEPGTNYDKQSKIDLKEFGDGLKVFMRTQRALMTVNIDPESPKFERILSNLEEEADVYIDLILEQYRKSKGAFGTFGQDGTDGHYDYYGKKA